MISAGCDLRLTKTRLISNKAICTAIKASLTATKCFSKRYPISMRHYVVKDGIYCTAKREKIVSKLMKSKSRFPMMAVEIGLREQEEEEEKFSCGYF